MAALKILVITVALATVITALLAKGLVKGDTAYMTQARNDPSVADNTPFKSEVDAVEDSWGEPIPDHLMRIGGLDEWSWASVSYRLVDGAMYFEGEFRNHKLRYIGSFKRIGGRDSITPKTIFINYVMSHIDGTDLVMREIGVAPPWDHIVLRPTEPEKVEISSD